VNFCRFFGLYAGRLSVGDLRPLLPNTTLGAPPFNWMSRDRICQRWVTGAKLAQKNQCTIYNSSRYHSCSWHTPRVGSYVHGCCGVCAVFFVLPRSCRRVWLTCQSWPSLIYAATWSHDILSDIWRPIFSRVFTSVDTKASLFGSGKWQRKFNQLYDIKTRYIQLNY